MNLTLELDNKSKSYDLLKDKYQKDTVHFQSIIQVY